MSQNPKASKMTNIDLLDLDKENPRLFDGNIDEIPTDEISLIKGVDSKASLKELLVSYKKNGYLNIEPIIILKYKKKEKDRYIVLEGNRRIAALKVIKDKNTAEELGYANLVDGISSVDQILCYEVDSRSEADPFIGFKHVTGAYKWDSIAKAKFARRLYSKGETIEDIAQKMGDSNNTIRSMIRGLLVIEQAENKTGWKVKNRTKSGRFAFSHIYTALVSDNYKKFLGIEDAEWNQNNVPIPINPIPEEKEKDLELCLQFMYGDKSEDTNCVIGSQNPDLKKLGEVLNNPKALDTLKRSQNLDIAYAELKEDGELFLDEMLKAKHSLNISLGIYRTAKKDKDTRDAIEDVFVLSQDVKNMVLKD